MGAGPPAGHGSAPLPRSAPLGHRHSAPAARRPAAQGDTGRPAAQEQAGGEAQTPPDGLSGRGRGRPMGVTPPVPSAGADPREADSDGGQHGRPGHGVRGHCPAAGACAGRRGRRRRRELPRLPPTQPDAAQAPAGGAEQVRPRQGPWPPAGADRLPSGGGGTAMLCVSAGWPGSFCLVSSDSFEARESTCSQMAPWLHASGRQDADGGRAPPGKGAGGVQRKPPAQGRRSLSPFQRV